MGIHTTHSLAHPFVKLTNWDGFAPVAKLLYTSCLDDSLSVPECSLDLYHYPSLSEIYGPRAYNFDLQGKILSTMIRSFPGDLEFFRFSVLHEQVIRYDDDGQ